ncbi:MAG TPA: heat-inducible transcriptional repressor HrcA [Actinomycetota bacterium]|nr:heat-inducible transcriptional repressor HrcA [Actinomycetota bacterium]
MTTPNSLDDRKAAILRAIVSHYVSSGQPVGSKTLVDRYRLGVSSATVRNEMSALEDQGFIYQPHTSAGRVPTDAGYRYFVDTWARDARLPAGTALQVRRFFGEPRWELEDALRNTAELLSSLTESAAVVFAPALEQSTVRHVELVSLAPGRAMLVVVSDAGRVFNHPLRVAETIDDVQLEHAADMLNRLILGHPLDKAAATIASSIDHFPLELREAVATVASALTEEFAQRDTERVFLEGASNIVDEHKFADLETVRQVIGALEHRRLLLEVLADAVAEQSLSVRIGSENDAEVMQNCAVITAPYGSEESVIGSLGVVGPTRMDYRRTIPAVYEVASNLGRMLTELGL